jgi:hypothetical protein
MGEPQESVDAIIAERKFMARVSVLPRGCHEWTGAKKANGYGEFYSRSLGRVLAHRFSWLIHRGKIPAGLMVLHKCHNRGCVNPDHLYIGTARDNALDAIKAGRMVTPTMGLTHCPKGHEFMAVAWKRPQKLCRICQRAYSAARRKERRAARLRRLAGGKEA